MGLNLTERLRAGLGTFEEWKRDRDADIARAGANIQARADQLYRGAIRTHQDIAAKTPSEVRELVKAAATLGLPGAAAVATARQVARQPPGSSNSSQRRPSNQQKPTLAQQLLANADRIKAEAKQKAVAALERAATDPHAAKAIGGLAEKAGQATGAVKGALQTAEDIKDGAIFVSRAVNPFDVLLSPPGQSAREQAARGIVQAIGGVTERAKKVIEDPRGAVDGVVAAGRQMRRNLDPSATPAAPTITGEIRRRFDIGQNQGDLGMEAASLVVGGPTLKAVSGAARASNIGNVAKYSAQGFPPAKAAHLAERYDGEGDHVYIKKRHRLPEVLGGGPFPRWALDNPLNLRRPENMSRGDFYVSHKLSDRSFWGAQFPRRVGGGGPGSGWSARRLGLETPPLPLRVLHGMPDAMKLLVGGGAIAGAGYLNEALDREANR